MLALWDPLQGVGDRGHRRPHAFERRLTQPHALDRLRERAEDAVQGRIGRERAEEGFGFDQLRHIASHFVDGLEENAVAREELAPVRPGHGADQVRLRRQRIGQRRGRLLGCFRRRRVYYRDDPIGPLREKVVEPHLLLAPGERARQELAAVGVDGDVAREIDAGENGHDKEARNHEPGMTGRKAYGPPNCGDDQGAVVSVHGSRVEAMVRAVLSIGNGEAGLFGPSAIEANMGSRAPGSSFAANGFLPRIARSSSDAHCGPTSDFQNKCFCKTELRAMLLRWLIPPKLCGRRRRALSCP